MKKILVWVSLALAVIISFSIYWNYYNTFSEGNRSGLLQKFSHKGNVFKTYEGELIMNSISNNGNGVIGSEKFYFSVTDDKIAQELFTLEGKKVTLHYLQKRGHLPWNGDTDYYIDSYVMEEVAP